MKKIFMFFILIFNFNFTLAEEIFQEKYIFETVILDVQKAKTYNLGEEQYKALKVDKKIMKKIGADGELFSMVDSTNKKSIVKLGDYIVSPSNLSYIYVVDKESFSNLFNK